MISQAHGGAKTCIARTMAFKQYSKPFSPHSAFTWCRGHRLNLAAFLAAKDVPFAMLINRMVDTLLTLWETPI